MSQDDRDRLGITTVGSAPSAAEVEARRRIREMGGAAVVVVRLDALRAAGEAMAEVIARGTAPRIPYSELRAAQCDLLAALARWREVAK